MPKLQHVGQGCPNYNTTGRNAQTFVRPHLVVKMPDGQRAREYRKFALMTERQFWGKERGRFLYSAGLEMVQTIALSPRFASFQAVQGILLYPLAISATTYWG